ncbi:hypothetical protein FOA52_008739 [Chlamydomonas sp. UWO 241]|nr:hypothetical protein FOA52_008739 [Chlamydomonas sp. UWO 241]
MCSPSAPRSAGPRLGTQKHPHRSGHCECWSTSSNAATSVPFWALLVLVHVLERGDVRTVLGAVRCVCVRCWTTSSNAATSAPFWALAGPRLGTQKHPHRSGHCECWSTSSNAATSVPFWALLVLDHVLERRYVRTVMGACWSTSSNAATSVPFWALLVLDHVLECGDIRTVLGAVRQAGVCV